MAIHVVHWFLFIKPVYDECIHFQISFKFYIITMIVARYNTSKILKFCIYVHKSFSIISVQIL